MLSSCLPIARSVLVRATPVVKTLASLASILTLVCHRLTTCGGEVRSSDVACRSHTPFVPGSLSTAEGRNVIDGAYRSVILGTQLLKRLWSIQQFCRLLSNFISLYLGWTKILRILTVMLCYCKLSNLTQYDEISYYCNLLHFKGWIVA